MISFPRLTDRIEGEQTKTWQNRMRHRQFPPVSKGSTKPTFLLCLGHLWTQDTKPNTMNDRTGLIKLGGEVLLFWSIVFSSHEWWILAAIGYRLWHTLAKSHMADNSFFCRVKDGYFQLYFDVTFVPISLKKEEHGLTFTLKGVKLITTRTIEWKFHIFLHSQRVWLLLKTLDTFVVKD